MPIRAYLDNNATTRPHDAVIEAVRFYQDAMYLNAASVAGELLGAANPLTDARAALRDLFGAAHSDAIILTSGATEANSWAIFGSLVEPAHAILCASEHSSLLAAGRAAAARGHRVDYVCVDTHGEVRPNELAALLLPDTRLVSIQLANNETGVVQPLASLATIVREQAPGALIHTDATQAVGRIPINLSDALAEIDLLSFSAHKFHGPKGIGGLFIRDGISIAPLIPGEQENGLRGGTSNVPGAAGLAIAARAALGNLPRMEAIAALRDRLEAELCALRGDARVHSAAVDRIPNTSLITFPGLEADNVVEQLALHGICIATGSACTAGATAPSHVLTAMGVSAPEARATLRFSLSVNTTAEEISQTVAALVPYLFCEKPDA